MSTGPHHDAFLRVLAAAAWADGKIAAEEMNVLKRYARDLGVGSEGWARLEPYLDEPIESAEAEVLVRDFFERIAVPSERRALLAAVEEMAKVDGRLDPREHTLLSSLAFATQGASAVDVVLGRLRELFGIGSTAAAEPFRHQELADFRQHRLLYRLRRRMRAASLEIAERELMLAAALGTLLARVAGAERTCTDASRSRISDVLGRRMSLAPEALAVVVITVCAAATDDLDRTRATADLLERSTADQRVDLVEALFEVAAADGPPAPKAVSEVRAISRVLQVPDARFADAKARVSRPPTSEPKEPSEP